MTLAKSLTAPLSAGGDGCASNADGAATSSERTSSSRVTDVASSDRRRRRALSAAARYAPNDRAASRDATGLSVRLTTAAIARPCVTAELLLPVVRWRGVAHAVERCQIDQERTQRRRGCGDEAADRRWLAFALDEPLPQVQKKPPRLHFARPPQVAGLDRQPLKRVRPVDDTIAGENRAEFERECIESTRELVPCDQERDGDAVLLPRSCTPGTRFEIGHRQLRHPSQCMKRRVRRRPDGVAAIHDDSVQPQRKDRAQVGDDSLGERRHLFILRWERAEADVLRVESLADAISRDQRRLCRWRDGNAEPPWRSQAQSLASRQRHRHHVRQRRELGAASRRAWACCRPATC